MRAMLLGGADCVWQDIDALEQMLGHEWADTVIAVNDIGCHWPRPLHHWVSLHPNKFKKWQALRAAHWTGNPLLWARTPVPFQTWGTNPRWDHEIGQTHNVVIQPWQGGSSGMFAVQVAKELGVSRAVLCGIPMTPTGHFAESREEFGPTWGSADAHWRAWKVHFHKMDGWVRSMSGRTRDLLGMPTGEWLNGD